MNFRNKKLSIKGYHYKFEIIFKIKCRDNRLNNLIAA